MPALLRAVCVVTRLHDDPGSVGTTAIDKGPVDGPVRIGPLGLYADVQADRKHHGGPDKAVYAYSDEDADWWAEQLGREIPPGLFGENLRVAGVDTRDPAIGERWRVGRAVLEVTLPRTPCATFARWMGEEGDGWVRRFSEARRLGAYLRVVETGSVRAGDAIEIIAAPAGSPTILDIYRGV